jgi:hypothetical protein
MTRAFVIDTCVARSCAGKGSTSAHATNCRRALETIRDAGHDMVSYPALEDEYQRQENMSRFFLRFYGEMRTRRRIQRLDADPPPYQDIHTAMRRHIPRDAHPIVKKDLHLVGAALATDERILSDDDKVRAHFVTIAAEVTTLARVHWANPSDLACLPWLSEGAPSEPLLQLGARRS